MWYVVDADAGSYLYVGFKEDVTKERFKEAIENGTVISLLNRFEVKRGDVFFIPAGVVHAIGKGCLIYEIQQSSNVTYRIYDYDRTDGHGNKRQLHIKQALEVTDLRAYSRLDLNAPAADGAVRGASKHFTFSTLRCDGGAVIKTDKNSFRCITCLDGHGQLNGRAVRAGNSFFVPAEDGELAVSGKMTLAVASVRRYAVGIDLGGTFIKGGIADDLGNVIASETVPTEAEYGAEHVSERIAELCGALLKKAGMTASDVEDVGIGAPGMIDRKNGVVVYSNNLRWSDFRISDAVGKLTGLDVYIANDANVAALGEARYGAGKGLDNVVLITLGTGVGGGIIINGKLYEGAGSAGAELGHISVQEDGELCTCGRRGCLEAYVSATALIRDIKRAVKAHPESLMSGGAADGRTAFKYKDSDKYAAGIVDAYVRRLGCGVADIANLLRPDVILLGGGISAEGDALTKPVQQYVNSVIFGKDKGPSVPVKTAELGNKAGISGASALVLEEK